MKKSQTILHVTPFFAPNVGGVETHLTDLLKKSSSEGFKSMVVTYQPVEGGIKGKSLEKNKEVEIHRLNWLSGFYYKTQKNPFVHFLYLTPRLFFGAFFVFKRNESKVDIIHTHGINAAYCGAMIKTIFNKPHIVSMHVDFHLPKSGIIKKFILWPLTRADSIMVLTDHSKKELKENGINPFKINKYSYWVNQQIFLPMDKTLSKKKLGFTEKFVVLYVGRLTQEKGVLIVPELAKKLPNIRFVVAGSGALSKEFENLGQKFSNITFVGKVENTQLPLYYNAANILLVPSLTPTPRPLFEEGVPRVILEALSCGLPFMGTDNGGIKEVLEMSDVGFLVEPNVDSITKTLRGILKNNAKLKELSKNAVDLAKKRFGTNVSSEIFDTYRRQKIKEKVESLLVSTGDTALKRRSRWIYENIAAHRGKSLLDVGCGDGFYLHSISELFPDKRLVGTDYEKRSLESAKRNLSGKKIKLVWGDLMRKLPFEDNSFDEIVMSEVTEHLPDDVRGLKEVSRVMKPGAIGCITVPHANYPFMWDPINWLLERLFETHIKSGFFAGIWNQHERLYTREEIARVLKKAGFEILEQKYVTWWCLPFSHYLINMGARILVKGGGSISKGANKFQPSQKRSLLPGIYFALSGLVDKLNDILPVNSGVSVVNLVRKNSNK